MTDASAFDAAEFLNSQQSAGFDTRYAPHNVGDFRGTVGTEEKDIQVRPASWTDKDTGQQVNAQFLEVRIYPDDQAKARPPEAAPEAKMSSRYSARLDFMPDGKSLDMTPGKNKGLGALLFALGFQSKDGKNLKPWSPAALRGLPIIYHVKHAPRKDTGEMTDSIDRVAAAS